MAREIRKYKWKGNEKYHLIGDDIVLRDAIMYNYDDDAWRYAPEVWFEFVMNSNYNEIISEEEARKIVEENGGKNFDKQDEVLFVDNGKYLVGV